MTVFLGNQGRILLARKGGDQAFISLVDASDVRTDVKRFSVDFGHEQFITGDRVELKTLDGSDLNWIDDPAADDSFTRFVHVDAAGGMRLYDTFADSLRGDKNDAIALKTPAASQETAFRVVDSDDNRCLAQVTQYQITTARETIDTTNLGAHYRKQYESGLIQGQGQIECFWDKATDCVCSDDSPDPSEFSSYLARLCLRFSWCCFPWLVLCLHRRLRRRAFGLVRRRNLHRDQCGAHGFSRATCHHDNRLCNQWIDCIA